VPLLEAHALFLLNAGRCVRGEVTTSDSDVYPKSIHSSGSDYNSGSGSGSRSRSGGGSGGSGSGSESDSLVNGHGSQIFFRSRLGPLRLEAVSMARVPHAAFPAARLP
jgi:hypothetical protein